MLKEKATTHVAVQYKLQPGCKALVTALLAGQSYIFPGDVMNVHDFPDIWIFTNFSLQWTFSIAIYGTKKCTICPSLQLFMLKCSLKAIYRSEISIEFHPHHFTNSIEGGDPHENEVPPAMLELAATAVNSYIFYCLLNPNNTMTTQVHAALLEWADGYYQASEFSYNRSLDIYDLHLQTLKYIFTYNIHGFHCTLSDLYRDATWVVSLFPSLTELIWCNSGCALIVPMEDCNIDFSVMPT